MSRACIVVLASALADPAAADEPTPWYRGKYGKNRVTHLTLTAALGVGYLASELAFKDTLAPDRCRWCDPPAFDRGARDLLVWDDTDRAAFLSDLEAYVIGPGVAMGLLIASERDASASRLIDDILPVAESVVVAQVITQVAKASFGRQRPYAHFGTGSTTGDDVNLSFWSGHSALAFSLTTSAGLVAHWRGYWTEPYIWGAGITIALTTEYLRVAADRHYLSDVLVGGLVGVGSGLLVPRLMRRELRIVPVANTGAAVVGRF